MAGALQVTPDVNGPSLSNNSGRILYNQPFKLWNIGGDMKASFKSSFVFNIYPVSSPPGDGLAFILTQETSLPLNSGGQWLGIINSTTTGSTNIVAVEFDTRKSYAEDIDDNHVGIDVRSAVSMNSRSLSDLGLNLSSGMDIMATVQYDADSTTLRIFVSSGDHGPDQEPLLSGHLDLSDYLPQDVYVGFSASTGVNATQLNIVKSWNFTSYEISNKKSVNRLWIWITVSVISVSLLILLVLLFRLYWKRKQERELLEEDQSEIELKIQNSSTAPQKFHLKELKFATQDFSLMNKLGKGGFGTVYKGILGNKAVAVKRISKNSRHGKQDFIAEVTSIGNLHHKNLVKLIGWMDSLNLVLDSRINEDADKEQIKSVLMLGLACCHPNPYERPSMKSVLKVLTGEVEPPEVAVEKPAFMWPVSVPLGEVCSVSMNGGQYTAMTELSGR
ncbi:hypothetical protein COLO4_07026 [Corchorus olitorius]|uniref:non-specific serine/threonine protein kinase n=1 Tax=Corchorus olitorius TaxID=93759 RepID=A0A1R3KL54_9ROSI|nr:hypothetical protein COLO4_07026 [Corchorus olitorius]